VVDAEDGIAMAAAMRELEKLPDDARAKIGQAGKMYVTEHYDRETLSRKFLNIIQNAVCQEN
jgi:glycosyltransferase involved in cell wall biosynthesis